MPRKTKTKQSNKTILIIAEGQTEQIYFSEIKSIEKIAGITIIPKLAKHSDLYSILNKALSEKRGKIYDEIWCVFDRDIFISNNLPLKLKKKLHQAQEKGINFADSLPAFEIWFLLHYEMPNRYYTKQDELIKQLQKHISQYEKKQKYLNKAKLYSNLKPRLNDAISNSKTLEKRNNSNSDNQSSFCNVYRLFENLKINNNYNN